MSEDSQQVGLDEITEQSDKPDMNENLHPHIRQLGIQAPDGWKVISLGELGQLDTSSVNKKSKSEEETVNLVNYMDVYENYQIDGTIDYMDVTAPESHIERSQVRPGDILFTPSSEEPRDIGNSAVVTEEMERTLHSYHTVRLRPTSDSIQLDTGFSGWFANAPYVAKQFARRATGSTRYTLTLGDFSDTQILIPPIPEQRKIATVLYTVDRAIEKTEAIVQQGKQTKEGLVKEIVTGGIDAGKSHTMRVGPHEFEIPAYWDVVSISESCENLDSERIPVSKSNREDMQGDIPYYGASGCVDYVDDYLFDEPLILLAEDGENLRSRTQRVAFKINGKSWVNNHAHVLRPKDGFELDYLVEYLERLDYRPYVSGSAQPKLNQTMMNKVTVPKPPLEEQKEIASVLNDSKQRISHENKYLSQLKRLKRGLMQDLLSGTVRTTDTNITVPDDIAQYG